ncbi:uridine kinase [Modestobacter sp. I12A-02628]|uniref:Uridine kinase n=1 Tax=Goekera deserti TaxID=2497753 RepID=A0A7K3WHL8_9ACTN|nr:AAA family ATPase [Goekera deserti]MPQ98998.1 uridine kinase [Goekera deserti]NDI47332.1 uridine kinase [Goekera deserti]NEL55862.1 uridine kinase [Goekera deserti]
MSAPAPPGGPPTVAALARRVLDTPPRLGGTRLVSIDGPAGSGKTTFAGRLADAVAARTGRRASLVHMEDLYTGDDVGSGWSMSGAVDRLDAGVLRPVREGRPGSLHRWDWAAGAAEPAATTVPVAEVLLVEGCGASPRRHDPWTSLRVWVEAPAELCLRRGLARDGAELRPWWERWQAEERAVFAAEDTRARADVRVDGAASGALPPDRYALL